MKKLRKIVSYLLALALMTSLFAGVAGKEQEVKADYWDGDFVILEIVPHLDMGTVGYLVPDSAFESSDLANMTRGGQSKSKNAASTGSNFYKFLVNGGYGEFTSNKYTSNYFAEHVLNSSSASVKLITRTPDKLEDSELAQADLIIINETVPSALKVGSGNYNVRFDTLDSFTWDKAYKIFKRIAGIDCAPVPYMIDANMGRPSTNWVDVRAYNITNPFNTNKTHTLFGWVLACDIDKLTECTPLATNNVLDYGSEDHTGSNKPSYKLFKMLSAINPATFYGLFIAYNDDSYGINPRTGDLISVGVYTEAEPAAEALGVQYPYWGDKYIRPYYLMNVYSKAEINSIMDTMGWKDSASWDYSKEFCYVIGGSKSKDGSGIAYKFTNGIFPVMAGESGDGAATTTTSFDPSEYTDITSRDDIKVTTPGCTEWNSYITIKNSGSAVSGKWMVVLDSKGTGIDAQWNHEKFDVVMYKGKMICYGNNGLSTGESPWSGKFSPTLPVDFAKSSLTTSDPDPGTTVRDATLSSTILNFNTSNGSRNDYHPYAYLVTVGHNKDASVGSIVNRSLIARMVEYANSKGYGLPGGIRIDVISDYNDAGLSTDFTPVYDQTFSMTGTLSSSDADTVVGQFESDLDDDLFGVKYTTVPTEYFSSVRVEFREQNSACYYPVNSTIEDKANFINDKYSPNHRTLDFDFEVLGDSDYTVNLYVDKNHDDKFSSDERAKASDGSYNLPATSGKRWSIRADLNKLLEKDFVGGFSWRLVVTDSNSGRSVARVGYSALRNTKEGKHEIRILQIYPTDYTACYNNTSTTNGMSTGIWSSNPVLLLPTKTESEAAKVGGKSISQLYDLTNIIVPDGGQPQLLSTGFENYFSGKMTIDACTSDMTSSSYRETTVAGKKTLVSDIVSPLPLTTTGGVTDNRLICAALLQYYIDQLEDFDVNVDRYSVYGFNKAVYNGEIQFFEDSKKLGKATSETISNADKSQRYLYKATDLGLSDDDLKEKVLWAGAEKNKYLLDDATGLVYGYRKNTPDEYYYYKATENVGGVNKSGKVATKQIIYDLVVLGFGSTMDYMREDAVDLIEKYIDGNGPVLAGKGTVTRNSTNTLGQRIRGKIGMSADPTEAADGPQTASMMTMTTNNTLFANYPFKVPHYFKTSGADISQYMLNLGPDMIVSYAKYAADGKPHFQYWGYCGANYYLYKYKNITYCGFGQTAAVHRGQTGQQGGVPTLAEDIMIVNALVTSSRFRADGYTGRAKLECIDVDRSVLSSAVLEDDEFYTVDPATIKQDVSDAVYTDYSSIGLARESGSSMIFNDVFTTIDDPDTEFKLGEDSLLSKSLSINPENLGSAFSAGTNIRWIPFKPTVADTTYNLTIETYKVDSEGKLTNGTKISNSIIKVYEYNTANVANSKFISPNSEDGTNTIKDAYKLKNNKYYIGVPLDTSSYGSLSGLGFDLGEADDSRSNSDEFKIVLRLYSKVDGGTPREVETHVLTMVRRVLFPVE